MTKIDGDYISDDVIKLCHTEAYLLKLNTKVGMDDSDPMNIVPCKRNSNVYNFSYDTYENRHTATCAKLSAGSVLELIDALYSETIKQGF